GLFAVDEDRVKIAPMLEQAFSQSVKSCLIRGDILKYRILLNKQTIIMRGLPMKLDDPLPGLASFLPADDTATGSKSHLLAQFLHRNGFREVQERNFSVIGLAALFRNHDAVEVLLRFRADVNTGRRELLLATPLGVACRSGDVSGIRLLLEKRADPHVKDIAGVTAFDYTLVGNSPAAMEAISQHGLSIDPSDVQGSTQLGFLEHKQFQINT
ncbi:ANKRD27, partial [Symbiodinium pilosum]